MEERNSIFGETDLQVAVHAGDVNIVEVLLGRMSPEAVKIENEYGDTALTLAAAEGKSTGIAKLLIAKDKELIAMQNYQGNVPVVVAAQLGHKKMAYFLYHETPDYVLKDEQEVGDIKIENYQGAKLFNACLTTQLFDIALDMIKSEKYENMCREILKADSKLGATLEDLKDAATSTLSSLATSGDTTAALNSLAARPSLFRYGDPNFLERWIYSRLPNPSRESAASSLSNILMWVIMKVPGMKAVYKTKLQHAQTRELLSGICKLLLPLHRRVVETFLRRPILKAVLHGNVGFIAEVAEIHPRMLWVETYDQQSVFAYAVANRQHEVYSYMCRKMGENQCVLRTLADSEGNTILHQAAKLSASSRLSRLAGPALKMQRELKWFKEIERIAPGYVAVENKAGLTPKAYFTKEHKKLVKEGEQWMKSTAQSCTVAATLIVTIMFAAAFTVPGGYHGDTGLPIFLHSKYFIIFIIAAALSLFNSSISVFAFLGILTSLFREEDFLKSLPSKLVIGLFTLSVSIVSMMIAFSATIILTLRERFKWITMPIVIFASIPPIVYALMQSPLISVLHCTWGNLFENHKIERRVFGTTMHGLLTDTNVRR